MGIAPVSFVNFKWNKSQAKSDSGFKQSGMNQLSNPVFPDVNTLKAQSLFRLSNNHISFKGILKPNLFMNVAANESNPLWTKLIARESELYPKTNELRSEFERDYNRILHSDGYNRMMGKAQVFINPNSDITSTRILHVNQVASVAESISDFFGLNSRLTRAIAMGHDIGHTPFGHPGEVSINDIIKSHNLKSTFWHEKNSLRFVDDIETKLDTNGKEQNLNLTYAVRDGIISHCGEVDENGLRPRSQYLDLRAVQKTDKMAPFTWEGCVMRFSDKIAYLGKDLEDAQKNKYLAP